MGGSVTTLDVLEERINNLIKTFEQFREENHNQHNEVKLIIETDRLEAKAERLELNARINKLYYWILITAFALICSLIGILYSDLKGDVSDNTKNQFQRNTEQQSREHTQRRELDGASAAPRNDAETKTGN